MTDQEGNRKIWLQRFRRAWKQLTIARGEAEVNSQMESREPDGFLCFPRDQSLFFIIAIHNKLKKIKNAVQLKNTSKSKTFSI